MLTPSMNKKALPVQQRAIIHSYSRSKNSTQNDYDRSTAWRDIMKDVGDVDAYLADFIGRDISLGAATRMFRTNGQ